MMDDPLTENCFFIVNITWKDPVLYLDFYCHIMSNMIDLILFIKFGQVNGIVDFMLAYLLCVMTCDANSNIQGIPDKIWFQSRIFI